jgi:hypothetical protein
MMVKKESFKNVKEEQAMLNKRVGFSSVINCRSQFFLLHLIAFVCYTQAAIAYQVSDINIDQSHGRISWAAGGVTWYAVVQKDSYFGESIPIIKIDLETGNETSEPAIPNCYYRGILSDATWNGIANTQAFINLCHGPDLFTGFVSNDFGVYTIEKDPQDAGKLTMELDDPTTPLTTPNETNTGNNGGNGGGHLLEPAVQIPRNSTPDKFPSAEILVEPSFIETFGDPGYIHRIAGTLAFANFIYQQNGLRQIHLISVDLLSGPLNDNGAQGGVRHQLKNLRASIVQQGSADVSILMVGGDIDSTYLWGWAIDGNACELQIAEAEDEPINTKEVGKASAFVIDLPSQIQRGWIFAHEFSHLIGASKHIDGDPLMDGWFLYIDTLSEYIAGCDAITQLYHSCDYDPKFKKVTDFYACE